MKVSQFKQKMQNRSKWVFFVYTAVCGSLFLTISAQHPTAIMFVPIADEALYIQQGMYLASGQWLGNYSAHTLIRGIGYPLFLALDYMTGLPIGIGQGLLYFVAVTYASLILSKICRNKIMFFVLPILLLTLPILYAVELQRLLRDYFYLSITLLVFSALFDLLFVKGSSRQHSWRAVILGLLLGVFWLTREEGIWIVPAIIIALVFSAYQQKRHQSHMLPRVFLAKILTTLASAALVIVATGSMNKLFYGRFVVNEIKDSSFQSAYNALQRASYMYHKPYLPVAKQARLRIYEQSPTFAKLKSYLDPDGKPSPWNYGCNLEIYRNICGDIAGGWFIWALRDAAAGVGAYRDPNTAAHFFDAIAREVDSACSQGRLQCLSRLPPLVPYMKLDEVLALPPHIAHALEFIAMRPPISVDAEKSIIDGNARERVLEFLNYPTHFEAPPGVQFNLNGWYRGQGNEWITIEGVGLQGTSKISRDPSPDLVSGFSDPLLDHNRFHVSGTCYTKKPCSLIFKDEHQNTLDIALPQINAPLGITIGGGQIYFDVLEWTSREFPTWRAALYERWARFTLAIKPLSSDFIIVGWVAFFAVMLRALLLRRMSATLMTASTLVIAVLCRAILLGLIDASSFPAVHYTYCAPAIPLAMVAATLAIFEALRTISEFRVGKQFKSGFEPADSSAQT
jgi:hypothetical protein